MFKEGWILVNNIPTHVLTWGGWIEDEITTDSVLICISGNPGVALFYSAFLSKLQSSIDIPVWIINHAGLEFPPNNILKCLSLNKYPHLYNLEGQIQHKYEFIRDYVPKDKQIYLIGHSVGAKMVTGVLQHKDLLERTTQTYFLFPTLQHIAKSDLGKIFTKYSKYFVPILLFLVWILTFFPLSIRKCFVGWYFQLRREANPDKCCKKAAVQLLNHKSLKAAFFLANDEMFAIKDLDLEVLLSLGERVNCYYGESDGWAPVWQCEDLKEKCPKAHTTVLQPEFKHAFVLSTPNEIADIISTDILKKKTLKKQIDSTTPP